MMEEQLLRRIRELEEWRHQLVLPEVGIDISTANVSNPPTDAELDAEFGTPAQVGAGYMALITDNGNVLGPFWLVVSNGTSWLYEGLTLAL